MRKITFLILLTALSGYCQVGVGTTAPNSTFEIVAANPTGTATTVDGILIPRVDRQRALSMAAGSLIPSTLIYVNSIATGTATGKAVNVTSVGFYYYDGAVWQKITAGANNNWTTTGNAGTTAGTNFIGTTDNTDFRIKTGATPTDRWNISHANNGQLQSYSLGTAALPVYSFQGDPNTGIFSPGADILGFSTTGSERARINTTGQVLVNAATGFTTSTLYSAATGNNNAVDGNSAGTGSSVYGQNTSSGNGVYGINNSTGKGVRGTTLGSGHGIWGMHQNIALSGIAVYGESFYGNGYSFYGLDGTAYSDNTFFGSDAFQGDTDSSVSNGVWGTNANVAGTAVLGGVNAINVYSNLGSGVAGSGPKLGVFGYAGQGSFAAGNRGNSAGQFTLDSDSNPATNTAGNGNMASSRLAGFGNIAYTDSSGATGAAADSYYGGYFSGGNENNGTPSYAYAGLRYNTNAAGTAGTNFKIVGPGSNSTIIFDNENKPRILFSPEAPEIVFQDFGIGKLSNGETTIALDPILKQALLIDEKHPLKVFITLEDDCNGVFVTNKSKDGFTVKELRNGTSNAAFSWQIVANRADEKNAGGEITSKHVDVRLPIGPGPLKVEAKAKSIDTKKVKSKKSAKPYDDKIMPVQETNPQ
ncbi:hypothetical protein [Flavobacterium sp.]